MHGRCEPGVGARSASRTAEQETLVARILVLGRQGAGKGTQSTRVAHRLGVPHVSTGDCFRAAVASGSALGRSVKSYLDRGDLVPDDVVCEIVSARLGEPDASAGFVLDGFPRTRPQAEALIDLLLPASLDAAVELDVPVGDVMERMLRRRVCRSCGAAAVAPKPGAAAIDCACGGEAVARDDDTAEAIRHRLALHDRETGPVLRLWADRGLLVRVDGRGPADDVEARLVAAIGARLRAGALVTT
ncbi:MAG TPA: adenylate kinase [Acidimicrobiales bacterium]|nr:adenylate kinase [Acidimicrobiales bacterium]